MSAQPGNLVPPPPTTTVNNNGSNMKGNVCRMYKVQYCTCKAASRARGPRRVGSIMFSQRRERTGFGNQAPFLPSLTHSRNPPCRVRGPGWSARTGMATGGMAMACHGKARQGKARQGKARQLMSSQDMARQGQGRTHTAPAMSGSVAPRPGTISSCSHATNNWLKNRQPMCSVLPATLFVCCTRPNPPCPLAFA